MAVMEGQERREAIIRILEQQDKPLSGSTLATKLQVSRQIIVQDMALLRAANVNIISTTRGYILFKQSEKVKRKFYVTHKEDEIEEELNIMVDAGGKVLDVMVTHPIYGEISVELVLHNRKEVKEFLKEISKQKSSPLMDISNGVHTHTVEADSIEILNEIEMELKSKGYLIEEENS